MEKLAMTDNDYKAQQRLAFSGGILTWLLSPRVGA